MRRESIADFPGDSLGCVAAFFFGAEGQINSMSGDSVLGVLHVVEGVTACG
jgi:hypothetical protein